jgi:hypothetical protein
LRSEVFNNITYSKIPLILHSVIQKPLSLEEGIPKTGSFPFYQQRASSVKQADVRVMLKNSASSVCCGIS